MTYVVELDAASAADVFRSLAPQTKRRVKRALRSLADDPTPSNPGFSIIRLSRPDGSEPVYRLRVDTWRILYTVVSRRVRVVRIMHRSEGYDWLEP